MERSNKFNYFPLTEVVIFTIAVLVSTIAWFLSDFSFCILISIIILSYLIIMGRATIIKLNDDTLRITPFNPLLASHSISIKSIIKIISIQTLEHQSDVDFGGALFLLTRRYELEYIDLKKKKRKAYFSILNRKKEGEVLMTLREISQRG